MKKKIKRAICWALFGWMYVAGWAMVEFFFILYLFQGLPEYYRKQKRTFK